jgi:hypothetical protein
MARQVARQQFSGNFGPDARGITQGDGDGFHDNVNRQALQFTGYIYSIGSSAWSFP